MSAKGYIVHLDPKPALVVFGLNQGIWRAVIRHELGEGGEDLLRQYSLLRLSAMNVTDALQTMPSEGDALSLIGEERCEQILQGYTSEHDDKHTNGELLEAALAYVMAGVETDEFDQVDVEEGMRDAYPWPESWHPSEDPIRNLTIAAALLTAEIDRLLRKRAKEGRAD